MSKETKDFWTSKEAAAYPYFIEYEGLRIYFTEGLYNYGCIWQFLQDTYQIPQNGRIIDLGAGSSSGYVFPSEIVKHQLWAAEISPYLLAANPVHRQRKLRIDIGAEEFPESLHQTFTFAVGVHLPRYLESEEKRHLAGQMRLLLKPDCPYVLIDTRALESSSVGRIMGECGPFEPVQEAKILTEAGFIDVSFGAFTIQFPDIINQDSPRILGYVSGSTPSRKS
jgi:hypothetical protein